MSDYNTNLKDWGAAGEEFPDGYSYNVDEPPVDVWDNWLNTNLIDDIQHLISLTNSRIETDKGEDGSEPASPESAHLYLDETNNQLEVWDGSQSSWRALLYSDDSSLRSDSDVVDLIDSEITTAATSVSGLDTAVRNKLESSNYTPVSDVDSEVDNSASTIAGLDDVVSGKAEDADISPIQSSSDVDHDSTTGGTDSDAHHTRYSDEEAEDAVAAILGGGDNITVTHDDANDTLTVDTSALDTEEVEDAVASLVGSDSNLSWTYDNPGDTLTISLSSSVSVSSLETKSTFTDPSGTQHNGEMADLSDINIPSKTQTTSVDGGIITERSNESIPTGVTDYNIDNKVGFDGHEFTMTFSETDNTGGASGTFDISIIHEGSTLNTTTLSFNVGSQGSSTKSATFNHNEKVGNYTLRIDADFSPGGGGSATLDSFTTDYVGLITHDHNI